MMFNLNKQKGSTIVEVIVSVIIIGIVSVYGMSFFASAYKHARDSKDYSFILHDLLRKMEIVRGGDYPMFSSENYYPTPITASNDKTMYDFKVDKILRNNSKVHYTCSVFVDSRTISGVTDNFDNSTKVVVAATWPWPESETAYTDMTDKNEIVLVTYMSKIWELDNLSNTL